MATSTRLIKRRIKSVTNTRKITKAMELVAASKMRRAVGSVLASRPYAEAAWRAVTELTASGVTDLHPLLGSRRGEGSGRILLILFTSDRGLCGGFNAQMLKRTFAFLSTRPEKVDIVTVGKKGAAAARRRGLSIVAAFTDLSNHPKAEDVRPVADMAISEYVAGTYDAVHMAFTDYKSALTQIPKVGQLLPIARIEGLGEANPTLFGQEPPSRSAGEGLDVTPQGHEYLFEPSPQEVLDLMLPRLVEAQVYQALLESTASEHSARMMAMRSASDSAGEMIDGLTLTFNQARQAGITAEIAEISSGKAALETN